MCIPTYNVRNIHLTFFKSSSLQTSRKMYSEKERDRKRAAGINLVTECVGERESSERQRERGEGKK